MKEDRNVETPSVPRAVSFGSEDSLHHSSHVGDLEDHASPLEEFKINSKDIICNSPPLHSLDYLSTAESDHYAVGGMSVPLPVRRVRATSLSMAEGTVEEAHKSILTNEFILP
ncbi:hypothetical protein RCL1_001180 [Eukaryota sp. TZLM3-RCL]